MFGSIKRADSKQKQTSRLSIMNLFVRIFLTFFVFISVYFFVYWVPFSIIRTEAEIPISSSIPNYISLLIAIIVAYFIWKKTGNLTNGLFSHILMGGIIIGGISFCAGFFGPMIVDPDANQGPLLGLFITGPIGFVVGLIAGGIFWTIKKARNKPLLQH